GRRSSLTRGDASGSRRAGDAIAAVHLATPTELRTGMQLAAATCARGGTKPRASHITMSTRNLKDGLPSGRTPALTSIDTCAETIDLRRSNAVAGMASRNDATVRAPRIVDTLAAAGVLEQLSTLPSPIAAVGAEPSAS